LVYSSLRRDINPEEAWNELKDCFKTLCIKSLALRDNNQWLNIKTTGFLTLKDKDEVRKMVEQEYEQIKNLGVTEVCDLLITFDVYNATCFLDFIRQLNSGYVTIRGELIKLGENVTISLEDYSHIYSQEPYNYPRISLIATATKRLDERKIHEVSEKLKTYGYSTIEEFGPQWLMLPGVMSYTFEATIDIPIYFLPLGMELENDEVIFKAICHKCLARKLKLRVTLKRPTQQAPVSYPPLESYRRELPEPREEIGEVEVRQRLESSIRQEDVVEYAVTSTIGIIAKEDEKVENLLRREVLGGEFPKLMSQFVPLDKLKTIIMESKDVGGQIREKSLAFQRAIAWLLSMLGFQVAELEGTDYKFIEETNGTRREIDILIRDPQKGKMYVVDLTLRSPSDEKIDDVANLQLLLQRKGVFAEPMIIVGEYAAAKKRNIRNVKMLDLEDLKAIMNALIRGNIEEARRKILS
jgi:hypothetical protein